MGAAANQLSGSQRISLSNNPLLLHLDLLHLFDMFNGRCFSLLNKDFISLGDSPGIWLGQGGAVRSSSGWLHVLPIVPPCSCTDPWLGVHGQATAPWKMLLTSFWRLLPLNSKFLCTGSDVVRLEPTASSNVTNTHAPGLTSISVHVKPIIIISVSSTLISLIFYLVQILGSRANGNSGRSINPCFPASGVW